MRIIGLLSWYDERPDWLERCVRSLAKVPVDHLVAVDGSYRLFPGGAVRSPATQVEAIKQACRESDIRCSVHLPDRLWMSEVEKRTFLFDAGRLHAEALVDWYLVMDADQVVGRAPDVKARLEATELDAAECTFIERAPASQQAPVRFPVRCMFRAIPGLHVAGNHYTYLTRDGRCLWGNPSANDVEPALDLCDMHVAHKTHHRDVERRARSHAYYEQRETQKVELDQCNDCGEPADRTVYVNPAWHPNGRQLQAVSIQVCDRCARRHQKRTTMQVRQLGVDPSGLSWMGYASIPA